jgi:hypothetical protein
VSETRNADKNLFKQVFPRPAPDAPGRSRVLMRCFLQGTFPSVHRGPLLGALIGGIAFLSREVNIHNELYFRLLHKHTRFFTPPPEAAEAEKQVQRGNKKTHFFHIL